MQKLLSIYLRPCASHFEILSCAPSITPRNGKPPTNCGTVST